METGSIARSVLGIGTKPRAEVCCEEGVHYIQINKNSDERSHSITHRILKIRIGLCDKMSCKKSFDL
jgi:hypothetical protein